MAPGDTRMNRVLAGLVAFVVLLFVIALPGLGLTNEDTPDADVEPTRITRYVASFDVSPDGRMRVTEAITVDFPEHPTRRGIFRYFDHYDDNAPGLRRVPSGLQVVRDGRSEPYTDYSEGDGRYTVARIGEEHVIVPAGKHTYVIDYTIDDVLLPSEPAGSRFYWNLVPGGWDQRIDRARLTVRLPRRAAEVKCAVEVGATSGCSVSGEGTRSLVIKASNLAPRTPVTLSTTLPLAAPETSALGWTGRWDRVLGDSNQHLVSVLGLAALAFLMGLVLARAGHESTPAHPLVYAPPEGIGPAQAQYILNEEVSQSAFVATMMFAAERGVVDLDRGERTWTLTGRDDTAALAALDPVTREVLGNLGVSGGRTFVAKPTKPSSGRVLAVAIATQGRDAREWAAREGLMSTSGLGGGGTLLVMLAGAAAFLAALYNPLEMSVVALVPGMFALGALSLLLKGTSTRRTAPGRELWSRVGGFRRVLATPSGRLRFDFSARRELYTAYLPWAVALGVADEWAAKYRTEMGVEPPVPAYFAQGYTGSHTGNHVDQMVNDFRGTVQSSVSAYEASIRPTSGSHGSSGGSSSSAGGFSGGGGGGGGGGGSW